MILADSEIKRRLKLWDLKAESLGDYNIYEQIWPASLDFRLWQNFKIYKRRNNTCIDSKVWVDSKLVKSYTLLEWEKFILHPWDFVLWVTMEKFKIPYDLVARCEWRSSIWRLWIVIHSTAWFVDPWFEGTITLEMTNINEIPVSIYPWMRIGQLAFETILWKVENTYDKRKWSKYMNQVLPEESRINKDLN